MSSKGDSTTRFEALVDAAADDIIEMSDRNLVSLMQGAELDPVKEASWVADIVSVHTSCTSEPLINASKKALDLVSKQPDKKRVPDTPQGRRSLFDRLFNTPGALPENVTLAFREGSTPSDQDIQGILEDLYELGLLDIEDSQE